MVLLTSSQVSVAISSAIVVSFTTALFLSGYVIQQRTVRNLRAAIRPDNSPHLILPDRFRDATTELEDGTVVMLDQYNRPVRLKAGRVSVGKPVVEEDSNVADAVRGLVGNDSEGLDLGRDDDNGRGVEITVQETMPEDVGAQQQQQKVLAWKEPEAVVEDVALGNDGGSHDLQQQPREPEESQQIQEQQKDSEPVPLQPQLAPWESRSEDDAPEPESPADGDAKPLSRAERRRKIKEEIQKLSQGETPLYYQRRLW